MIDHLTRAFLASLLLLTLACTSNGETPSSDDDGTSAPGGAGGEAGMGGGLEGGGGEGGETPGFVCPPYREDCNGLADDGCEVDIHLDESHCGGCGVVCDGYCAGGACVDAPLEAVPSSTVEELEANATHIFWRQGPAEAGIWRVDVNGGQPEQLVAEAVTSLSLGFDDAYYQVEGSPCLIRRVALDGSSDELIFDGPQSCKGVAAYGFRAHWVVADQGVQRLYRQQDLDPAFEVDSSSTPGFGAMRGIVANADGTYALPPSQNNVYRLDQGSIDVQTNLFTSYELTSIAPQAGAIFFTAWNNSSPVRFIPGETNFTGYTVHPFQSNTPHLATYETQLLVVRRSLIAERAILVEHDTTNGDSRMLVEGSPEMGPIATSQSVRAWQDEGVLRWLPRP